MAKHIIYLLSLPKINLFMKKLLSLPPNLVECFHDITNTSHEEWFYTNDPIGSKLDRAAERHGQSIRQEIADS